MPKRIDRYATESLAREARRRRVITAADFLKKSGVSCRGGTLVVTRRPAYNCKNRKNR